MEIAWKAIADGKPLEQDDIFFKGEETINEDPYVIKGFLLTNRENLATFMFGELNGLSDNMDSFANNFISKVTLVNSLEYAKSHITYEYFLFLIQKSKNHS